MAFGSIERVLHRAISRESQTGREACPTFTPPPAPAAWPLPCVCIRGLGHCQMPPRPDFNHFSTGCRNSEHFQALVCPGATKLRSGQRVQPSFSSSPRVPGDRRSGPLTSKVSGAQLANSKGLARSRLSPQSWKAAFLPSVGPLFVRQSGLEAEATHSLRTESGSRAEGQARFSTKRTTSFHLCYAQHLTA
jgi:hypothetical protein